jgi:hypothetical protein
MSWVIYISLGMHEILIELAGPKAAHLRRGKIDVGESR